MVFDLDAAGARFNELLGQQVGRFRIAETGVDVGNDGHDVGDVVVDLFLDGGLGGGVLGSVQFAEQATQLAGVRLTQEGVQLADQRADRSLLVHRLVRQRAELGAQRSDHPARQVQVAAFGALEVLLDGNHLLLADEAVPATQRLRVLGRIGVVGSHVRTHDLGGVLGDVQTRLELVLGTHSGSVLGVDRVPCVAVGLFQTGNCLDVVLILGHVNFLEIKRV